MFLLVAWPVMLLLGAAHSQDHRIPAFGYWVTALLVLIASIVISLASSND